MTTTLDPRLIRRLADMHAVYRLFGKNGVLLYVGMSGRTGRRFDDHAVKAWWPLVATVTLEWHDTAAQAAIAERRAISTERPRYNRAGLQPPKAAPKRAETVKAAPEPQPDPRPLPPPKPRNLLDDLDAILGSERVKLADLPPRLRGIAPSWEPYKRMTARRLRDLLKQEGIRVTNSGNVLRLDPADLRVGQRHAG